MTNIGDHFRTAVILKYRKCPSRACGRSDHDPSRFNRIPVCIPSVCIPPWEIAPPRHIHMPVCTRRIWNVNYFDSRASAISRLSRFTYRSACRWQRPCLCLETRKIETRVTTAKSGTIWKRRALLDVFTAPRCECIIVIRAKIHYLIIYFVTAKIRLLYYSYLCKNTRTWFQSY